MLLNIQDYRIDEQIFYNPLLSIFLKVFRWQGYLIGKKQKWQCLHMLRYLTQMVLVLLCFILMAMRLLKSFENLNDGGICFAITAIYLSAAVSLVNTWLQRKRVVYLICLVHTELQNFRLQANDFELLQIRRAEHYMRLITYLICGPSYLTGSLICCDGIFRLIFKSKNESILIYKVFPFYEIIDNFYVACIGPFFATYLGLTTVLTWHLFFTSLMNFVTLMLRILNKRLTEMDLARINRTLNVSELNADELNYWRIELCCQFLQDILKIRKFVAEFEALICIPFFVDFVIFSMLICSLFVALTVAETSGMDFVFLITFIIVIMFIQWFYQMHANYITLQYHELSFAIYCCNWTSYSVSVQKCIHLLMMTTVQPLKLHALIIELSLSTFIDTVRGAYGYFNFIRRYARS